MDLSTWHGMRARDPRRLTLGTTRWASPQGDSHSGAPVDPLQLEAMLSRAHDAGIRAIDTARADGESEARIGKILRSTLSAEGWRVITKLAPDVHEEGLGIGESLERVATSLADSRMALGQDALPVLLLHRFDHRHACGGKLWRTLLAERDSGRIGSLGVAAATPEEAWAALEDPDVEVIQVASSLLDLRLLRQGFFPRARELGRTIYVRDIFLHPTAPLVPTALPDFLAELAAPMRLIRSAAHRIGVSPRALYLGFAREFLPGAYPVIACDTRAQLDELLADWEGDEVDGAKLSPLIEALPTLDARLIEPGRWPAQEKGREIDVNQTVRASVATMRR